MRHYVSDFLKEEDGVETMEWIAIVVVAAVMIGIAAACGKQIKEKLSGAVSFI